MVLLLRIAGGWSVLACAHACGGASATWSVIAKGQSIGNKWITLLEGNLTVRALKAVVNASAAPSAKLRSLSAHLCPHAAGHTTCSLRQNWAANGLNPRKLAGNTETDQCCAACKKDASCAMFVLRSGGMLGIGECTLYTATSAGGKAVKGAITGTP